VAHLDEREPRQHRRRGAEQPAEPRAAREHRGEAARGEPPRAAPHAPGAAPAQRAIDAGGPGGAPGAPGVPGGVALPCAVLAIAFVFEGTSWLISLRAFRHVRGRRGIWEAIRGSKDPTTFIVILEDSAALLRILIAATGIARAGWARRSSTRSPRSGSARC
jgi:hypothetical protein